MPSGRGDTKKKNEKKKSKEQLERELKKKGVAQPVQPMTFEIVKPKRKEKETWWQATPKKTEGSGAAPV